MTELSKERRDHLRDRTAHNVNGTNCVPINRDELRALLDMADERDMFRALLEEVSGTWKNGRLVDVNEVVWRIDAALEGKSND